MGHKVEYDIDPDRRGRSPSKQAEHAPKSSSPRSASPGRPLLGVNLDQNGTWNLSAVIPVVMSWLDPIRHLAFPSSVEGDSRKNKYAKLQDDEYDEDPYTRNHLRQPAQGRTTEAPSLTWAPFEEIRRWYGSLNSKRDVWICVAIILGCFTWLTIALAFIRSSYDAAAGETLPEWMAVERDLAVERILSNIGPIVGAKDGLVVASPSRREREDLPDYYYTWTRDSALVFSALHQLWLQAPVRPKSYSISNNPSFGSNATFILFENLLRSYISSQAHLQNTPNPSGDLGTGGLNEPKFHANGSAFLGDWGRPQRDGPALRALAMIPYAHYLLDRGYPLDIQYIKDNIWDLDHVVSPGKVIKNDLEEVAHHCERPGFDLWEEVDGYHLFTYLMCEKALTEGANLATRLHDIGAVQFYLERAEKLHESVKVFWDDRGYYVSSIPGKRSLSAHDATGDDVKSGQTEGSFWPDREWLDCSVPLSMIHLNPLRYNGSWAHNIRDEGDHQFHPTDPRILSTIYEYIRSFDGLYGINRGREWTEGWMMGRYREDVYDGVGKSRANPWFICTYSIAHVLYLAQSAFQDGGSIQTTNLTLSFWSDILTERVSPGEQWHTGDRLFDKAIKRLGVVADRFLETSRGHWDDGAMSEQVGRNDGQQKGARDLTWSYASYLIAVNARNSP
ncbi:hypothetical protein IAU59_003069 [Kwoniella sp. CBS 9459]